MTHVPDTRFARKPLFVLSALSAALLVAGCNNVEPTTTTNTYEVVDTVETQTPQQITGHIQGVLRDAVTQQPIANAVISIGFATATTDSQGVYLLENVPVTQALVGDLACDIIAGCDENPVSIDETYHVSIDLRNADSASAFAYPDFAYDEWSVAFSILPPTLEYSEDNSAETDPDTVSSDGFELNLNLRPQSGLVATYLPEVGKLSTAVEGTVFVDADQYGQQAFQPAAGAVVKLYSTGNGNAIENTGVGASGNLIAETTTDSEGRYAFQNVQADVDLRLVAVSANEAYLGARNFSSATGDGETVDLMHIDPVVAGDPLYQAAVVMQLLEQQGPVLMSVSPDNHADVSPASAVVVRYTFSKDIAQTTYALALNASSAAVEGLYSDVSVNYLGAKSSNVPFTLAWESARVLAITIPNVGVSSRYEVDISDVDLVDSAGRAIDFAANTANASPVLEFTTHGGVVAGSAPVVTITNSAAIDANSDVALRWAPVPGAKYYNVYRETVQVWDGGSNAHGYVLLGDTENARFIDDFSDDYADIYGATDFQFVENRAIELNYRYQVRAVNSDHLEGLSSSVQTAVDVVAPRLVGAEDDGAADIETVGDANGLDEITLVFSEPMEFSAATTLANYSLITDNVTGTPSIESVDYDEVNLKATLVLSEDLDVIEPDFGSATARWATLRTSSNGILNSDVATLAADFIADTGFAANADDIRVRITDVPDSSTGVCMTANADDLFYSNNSDNYPDTIPAYTPPAQPASAGDVDSLVGNDWVAWNNSDRLTIYTGPDGVCNLLQTQVEILNAAAGGWQTDNDAAGDYLTAAAALNLVSSALIPGATVNNTLQFVTIRRAEAFNDMDMLDDGRSNATLADDTAGEAAQHQYFCTGTRCADANRELGVDDTHANRGFRHSLGRNVFSIRPDFYEWLVDTDTAEISDGDSFVAPAGDKVTQFVPVVQVSNLTDVAGNAISASGNEFGFRFDNYIENFDDEFDEDLPSGRSAVE